MEKRAAICPLPVRLCIYIPIIIYSEAFSEISKCSDRQNIISIVPGRILRIVIVKLREDAYRPPHKSQFSLYEYTTLTLNAFHPSN